MEARRRLQQHRVYDNHIAQCCLVLLIAIAQFEAS